MDINNLNKSQFLLLLLLVIFVTSITTAAVTVTLLDQSPKAGITQTINRVIENTIEKIVPGATTTIVRVKEVPVVVSEGQQIAQAIQKVAPGVVKLAVSGDAGWQSLGSALAVRNDGLFATSLTVLPQNSASTTESTSTAPAVLAVFVGTSTEAIPVKVAARDEKSQVAVLKIDGTTTPSLIIPPWFKSNLLFGQTVVAIGANQTNAPEVSQGIVLSLLNSDTATSFQIIRTNAVTSDTLGGPLVTTTGEVSGLSFAKGYAISTAAIQALIDQIK